MYKYAGVRAIFKERRLVEINELSKSVEVLKTEIASLRTEWRSCLSAERKVEIEENAGRLKHQIADLEIKIGLLKKLNMKKVDGKPKKEVKKESYYKSAKFMAVTYAKPVRG